MSKVIIQCLLSHFGFPQKRRKKLKHHPVNKEKSINDAPKKAAGCFLIAKFTPLFGILGLCFYYQAGWVVALSFTSIFVGIFLSLLGNNDIIGERLRRILQVSGSAVTLISAFPLILATFHPVEKATFTLTKGGAYESVSCDYDTKASHLHCNSAYIKTDTH